MDKDLLEILACPKTHQKLRIAPPEIVKRVNQAIDAGKLTNQGGEEIEALEAGLLREDGKILYPIRDGIPVLLVDEGIAVEG